MAVDITKSAKNLPKTAKGVFKVNSVPLNSKSLIVSNRIIATASLASPSPRIIEKSLGKSSNLTIVIAAIMSELVKMDAMNRISTPVKEIGSNSPACAIYILCLSKALIGKYFLKSNISSINFVIDA